MGSIPGLGRSPGEGNSYPLQYSGLENSKDCLVHWVMEAAFTFTSLNYPVANCILSKVQIAQTIRCLPELFARNFRSAVSSSSPSHVRLIRNTDPKTGPVQVSDE